MDGEVAGAARGRDALSGVDRRTGRAWYRVRMGCPDTDVMREYARSIRFVVGAWTVPIHWMRETGTPDVVIRSLLSEAGRLVPEGAGEACLHEAREALLNLRQAGPARSRWWVQGRLASCGPGEVILRLCDVLDGLRGRPPLQAAIADRLEAALEEGGLSADLVDEAVEALRELVGAVSEASGRLAEAGQMLARQVGQDRRGRDAATAILSAAERCGAALAVAGPRRARGKPKV